MIDPDGLPVRGRSADAARRGPAEAIITPREAGFGRSAAGRGVAPRTGRERTIDRSTARPQYSRSVTNRSRQPAHGGRPSDPTGLPPKWAYAILAAVLLVAVGVIVTLGFPGANQVPGTPSAAPAPAAPPAPSPAPAPTSQLFVNPTGTDTDDGSQAAPLPTIQAALDKATPGTPINLAPGVYRERWPPPATARPMPRSRSRARRPGRTGPGATGRPCTAPGASSASNHSYYRFEGFTIDGQEKLADTRLPDRPGRHRRVEGQGAAAGPGQPADLHRRRGGHPRPDRHHDHQHVPVRRRRRVRPDPQQRPRQCDHRLGDPVLRHVRQGGRRRPRRSTTTARASTSAPARTPTTSRWPRATAARTTSSRAT